MKFSLFLGTALAATQVASAHEDPRVTVKNGTLTGVYNSQYNQDYFLGIPYAQPPVGNRRFRNPASYNESWADGRDAKALGPACIGYGSSAWGYAASEDCLLLNVYRPAGLFGKPLPVLVWIFGGGFVQGSGSDARYNLTFLVDRSVEMGQPIIAVNLNYRLSAWGFLASQEVADGGDSNFGLRDQRLALQWVHENIRAFGGDPSQVTIWGQSAGGQSVGRQLLAYGGRDDDLFRTAVMDSGYPISDDLPQNASQAQYNQLVARAGCEGQPDTLKCLREVPTDQLNTAINTTALINWRPAIDNDFIAVNSKQQFRNGQFVRVPIITGANTAEATGITPPSAINTTEQFRAALPSSYTDAFKDKIVELYPAGMADNSFPNLPADYIPSAYPYGLQYLNAATYFSDRLIASRRATCQRWAELGLPAYCYHFNAIPAWAGPLDGSAHFAEVAFAQYNLLGVGYAPNRTPPFQGLGNEFRDLARLMASDYIAFVNSGDPNRWEGRRDAAPTNRQAVEKWPRYARASRCLGDPLVFKYDANITSKPERDNWRKEGIALINSLI
ncbi:Alpha/Beta hydrolase protein [Microdochium trichocladiopsis]|uniref:Carboxylic ester hydrolase n=1 Tax=Microdochium trichocladiopsis TaxID=1682393 RepID=A0A9P9BP80_9PEZI|nr:Alpha/Beta hydrolase protein [Microdochium trichocladiopsis]KAH7028780.1 Alpha/Beta hydrolase protein [Microdochium trichocladiopsis]